ncbi:MAG: 5-methyltetrahydropteroyltriglutamate--homocysteine methyltransferase [Candidatus Tokpelaia hoelldobleri]|uniref:5-methyltetrahydropteroyltriglutamate--homocysteine methyltransferase n=1 Tax=Candidatus Tokpelaia hoelldobleri TaxID=1902579 RepID=A0A1U9JVC1_9HYPH|nr:MAG: 5-methyltetrahydropteroyltriglutamate--homocysteine methyltransferase [Candidatus Tokpelaia hoelldoblerii]
MTTTIRTAALGFPRIGARRELKTALEAFWSGKIPPQDLLQTAAALRKDNWQRQKAKGIAIIPSNDFSLYDHVLDTAIMVGAVQTDQGADDSRFLERYFALARGREAHDSNCSCGCVRGSGTKALEMTKWFDTNYHYLVPELQAGQSFFLQAAKPVAEFLEARALGIITRPVILGPVSFLLLAKCRDGETDTLTLLPKLVPVYQELLKQLKNVGCDWVQIDEPVLVTDLNKNQQGAFDYAYRLLGKDTSLPKILLASYFGDLGDNQTTALNLPVAGLHIDLVRGMNQLDSVVNALRPDQLLSLGVIDGRNVWRADVPKLVETFAPVIATLGADRVQLAPSCSLLHVPIDLQQESKLDDELKSWLAFAMQKLDELVLLARALSGEKAAVQTQLDHISTALAQRRSSPRIIKPQVRHELAQLKGKPVERRSPYAERSKKQKDILQLPLFPTTTIGSFPQSADVRKHRSAFTKGELSAADYNTFITERTKEAIGWQEEVGLDVLVHGEFERNDMVQYFGEKLDGFAFTQHGWVQSYGSRYVRPPIIYGDVTRPAPMTVAWWQTAQSFTSKPVKGMLTGPVTILNWSFVRDDQSREDTCRQIALAIRDEVKDLEKAGAKIIQIDEAALREGLPLKAKDKAHYLDWAVACFKLCQSTVEDSTQIHTHMCYSEFNDIIASIAAMDADVISIETSRSKMELLDIFKQFHYPNEIGPGVYDIHSPRIPAVDEITELLSHALNRLNADKLWFNPDCGLKTRHWEEVKPAIAHMVAAARILRQKTVQ